MAMFGAQGRLVIVEDADEFVTRFRPQLEDYVARPSTTAVLTLVLDSFPSNTRLYKAVAASGLLIDCAVPGGPRLTKWLADWAVHTHKLKLASSAAELLVEIVGPELGLLEQELAKLELVAGSDRKVSAEMVQQMAGGWRAKTTWEMLDAALAGNMLGSPAPTGPLAVVGRNAHRPAGADLGLAAAAGRRHAPDRARPGKGPAPSPSPSPGKRRHTNLRTAKIGTGITASGTPAGQPPLRVVVGSRPRSQRR